jgi:hypothetical protein
MILLAPVLAALEIREIAAASDIVALENFSKCIQNEEWVRNASRVLDGGNSSTNSLSELACMYC